jgi:hypothetical protein
VIYIDRESYLPIRYIYYSIFPSNNDCFLFGKNRKFNTVSSKTSTFLTGNEPLCLHCKIGEDLLQKDITTLNRIYASTCSRSVRISSGCSNSADMRIRLGRRPAMSLSLLLICWCVEIIGMVAMDLTRPRSVARQIICRWLNTRWAAGALPRTLILSRYNSFILVL